ncbi:cytidylate kinase [Pseudochelatococcus lubricantis]|uniref:Cytidylate kinase n=1 Tax=Pseudochelatococcus lubricantis TaxID=1538102 RepID=A0ABX0UXT5_9HYPH|nr:(d)CMP kinase [Pseudochelatococcus lubricantis]NIJ56685.1 cytidylate kinase [Pseudochelatococcus lubricantis]
MIIAIDGPAASGKGTLAKRLAAHFGLPHLDTGMLYRGVARQMLDEGARLDDVDAAAGFALSFEPGLIDDERLRGREMGEAASVVAAHPPVRAALLALQRAFAEQPGGAVLDGRDIGTVICPGADIKLFVTATPEVRARRRALELAGRGEPVDEAAILLDIRQRDARDSQRDAAPLVKADDAVVIDTSALDVAGVVASALAIIEGKRHRIISSFQ